MLVLSSLVFAGCYYDKEEILYPNSTIDCSSVNATYATGVAPIMAAKCATSGCHNKQSVAGGLILESYSQVSAASAKIRQRVVVEKTMPTSGPLPSNEIAIIKCWIDAGSPNN